MKNSLLFSLKPINQAFSLFETIMAVAISSLFMALIVSTAYISHNLLIRSEQRAIQNSEMAELLTIVSEDILNIDIYPRYGVKEFKLEKKSILFSVDGIQKKYTFEDIFTITSGEEVQDYPIVEDFKVAYFDQNDFEAVENEAPFYCILYFAFVNNKKVELKMKL
ncbi:MAG: hypothetical protein MJB14_03300 [Spirochaetes bacterium]|nr:hypothetical protein [Spirochaetota bacterium]